MQHPLRGQVQLLCHLRLLLLLLLKLPQVAEAALLLLSSRGAAV
jgi:hypothetical protein